MKLKKLLIVVLVLSIMATGVVFAGGSINDNEFNEGEIVSQSVDANLWKDNYMLKSVPLIMAPAYYPSTPPNFWVDWFSIGGSQAFSSNYIHYQLDHKSSCTNNLGEYASSGWVAPGGHAYSWLYSTTTNNKAYYDYRVN